MADVKWIKLTTDMFDNQKIRHLRRLPEGNNIVLIWIMLLTMAGRCNAGGMIFLTENIPYTTKMLADELGFEENIVKLAIQALERLDMIVADEDYFSISNWEKHQNTAGLDKIREQKRISQAKWRAKKALVESHVDSTENLLSISPSNSISTSTEDKRDCKGEKKPVRHKYGKYKRVLLSDEDLAKLKAEFPDWEARIERLDSYIESSGKRYASHLATIRNWARKDEEEGRNGKAAHHAAAPSQKLGTYL